MKHFAQMAFAVYLIGAQLTLVTLYGIRTARGFGKNFNVFRVAAYEFSRAFGWPYYLFRAVSCRAPRELGEE